MRILFWWFVTYNVTYNVRREESGFFKAGSISWRVGYLIKCCIQLLIFNPIDQFDPSNPANHAGSIQTWAVYLQCKFVLHVQLLETYLLETSTRQNTINDWLTDSLTFALYRIWQKYDISLLRTLNFSITTLSPTIPGVKYCGE